MGVGRGGGDHTRSGGGVELLSVFVTKDLCIINIFLNHILLMSLPVLYFKHVLIIIFNSTKTAVFAVFSMKKVL